MLRTREIVRNFQVAFCGRDILPKVRKAGAGGATVNLEEKTEIKYAWGLGIVTNNQAEALSLWRGLDISLANGIKILSIVDDCMMIIKKIMKLPENVNLL